MARTRRSFGAVRRLPSGRHQASYIGPDDQRHTAPTTFQTRGDADAWLALRRAEIVENRWKPPATEAPPAVLFGEYAEEWLSMQDHKPKTRAQYRSILDRHLLPRFADLPLTSITPPMVRSWYAGTLKDKPTMRAHTYALLRTICNAAVADDYLTANPCRITGAGAARRAGKIEPATLEELAAIITHMPDRLRLAVLLGAWCALRFGEVAALERQDVDMTNGRVHVRRAATYTSEVGKVTQTTKTSAGIRTVAIPPHLLDTVREHLRNHTGPQRRALLFPATKEPDKPMSSSTMHWHFDRAAEAAGRADLTFHQLRHTGAVLAASTGATLAELMARLGHDSPAAAMRYQHAARDRDAEIARLLSGLATPKGNTDD